MNRLRRVSIARALTSATDPSTYGRLDEFLKANHDDVLGLIAYTSVFVSELIKNWPKIKKYLKTLLYRLKLVKNAGGQTEDAVNPRALEVARVLNDVYGYIVDIRIAQGIFYIVPYIQEFFSDYSSFSKLRVAFSSWEGVDKFVTWFLFGNYQWLENLAFILSHDFLPNSFNHFLLDKHKKDNSLTTSDWYYVYSCALWCSWNVIANVKMWRKGQVDFNMLCDLAMSYHWARPDGWLDRPTFAVVGFANALVKFKKLL